MNAFFSSLAWRSSTLAVSQLRVLLLQFRQQVLALGQQVVVLDRLAQDGLQLLRVQRLGDVAVDAALVDGVDDGLDVGVGGEQQADGVGVALAQDAAGTRRRSFPACAGRS